MGQQRLQVELSDDAVAKLDAIAERTDRTRDAVLADAIEIYETLGQPVTGGLSKDVALDAALDDFWDAVFSVPGGRSIEDIDRQVRDNRGET